MAWPQPRLPLLETPSSGPAYESTCPVCSRPWTVFPGTRLPCHRRCLFDDAAIAELRALVEVNGVPIGKLAKKLGLTMPVMRKVLCRWFPS